MKKIIVVFFLMVVFDGYAQLTKGLIIKGKDTSYVDFKFEHFSNEFKGDKYFDSNGEKKFAKPEEIDEIIYFDKGDTIRMISHVDPIVVPCEMCKIKYKFMQIIVDGEMKLFTYRGDWDSNLRDRGVRYYYYQRNDDKLFSPNNLYFKKEMSEYFSDCEELVNKIKTKEFKRNDAEKIVEFYNTNCVK